MRNIVVMALVSILILAGVIWAGGRQAPQTGDNQNGISPTPETEVLDGWREYQDEEIGIRINHPPEMEVNEVGQEEGMVSKGVNFTLVGPSQAPATEFFDGISLRFSRIGSRGQTTKDFAQQQLDDLRNSPVFESGDQKVAPIVINNYQGFEYEVQTITPIRYIYLPAGENEVLEIVDLTRDPTGAGFEAIRDRILSDLVLM